MSKAVFIAGVAASAIIFGICGGQALAQEQEQTETQTPQQVIVEVNKGDSLSKIAKAHDSTYQRIFYANTFIENPNVIHPGEKVRIPSNDEELAERPLPSAPVKQVVTKKSLPKTNTRKQTVATPASTVDGSVWDRLAACESGGNWAINTGNGYYGGVQFSAATWRSVGGSGLPHQNSKEEQINRAQILQARSGWGQWPACSAKLGLR